MIVYEIVHIQHLTGVRATILTSAVRTENAVPPQNSSRVVPVGNSALGSQNPIPQASHLSLARFARPEAGSASWREALVFVKPATVVRWHR